LRLCGLSDRMESFIHKLHEFSQIIQRLERVSTESTEGHGKGKDRGPVVDSVIRVHLCHLWTKFFIHKLHEFSQIIQRVGSGIPRKARKGTERGGEIEDWHRPQTPW
jgi:hypothetical protein